MIKQVYIFLYILLFGIAGHAQISSKRLPLTEISFSGNFVQSSEELIEILNIQLGKILTQDDIKQAVLRFETALHESGYIYARIDSAVNKPISNSSGNRLTLFGKSGQIVYLGPITIEPDSLPVSAYLTQIELGEGDVYNPLKIKQNSRYLLEYANGQGFAFAELFLKPSITKDGEDRLQLPLTFRIKENQKTYIKGIRLAGNHYTKDYVILRELALTTGSLYSKDDLEQIRESLLKLNYFKEVYEPQLILTDPDSIVVQIRVEEGNATLFDGVIGYIPEAPNSADPSGGYFTGRINIAFRNLFGSGRRFAIFWEKPDQLSEEFFVKYTEPYLFNIPLSAGISLERLVRDTTYTQWQYTLNAKMRLLRNLSLLGSLASQTSIPDSIASADLGLLHNRVLSVEIGLEYDSRNYQLNPRSGIYYLTSYVYGRKENWGPSYLLEDETINRNEDQQTLLLQFDWYFNLWSNQVFSMQLTGKQISGDNLQLSDYFWFGGSKSLRGYRENQFRGDIVAWSNLEYRFLAGRNSRVFLFNDWGFYNNPQLTVNEVLYGYGLGLRFETPLGILGVDYGLGKGDGFDQGKIHFGIINQF